jgi:hypothetical protein
MYICKPTKPIILSFLFFKSVFSFGHCEEVYLPSRLEALNYVEWQLEAFFRQFPHISSVDNTFFLVTSATASRHTNCRQIGVTAYKLRHGIQIVGKLAKQILKKLIPRKTALAKRFVNVRPFQSFWIVSADATKIRRPLKSSTHTFVDPNICRPSILVLVLLFLT